MRTLKPYKLLGFLLGLVVFAFSATIYAADNTYPQQITAIINKSLAKNTQPKLIGIKIQSITTNKILYAKNSDNLFTPASTLKLFTALGAYLSLSPNFTFQTQLLTDNQHNIYIKFDGDPSFTDMDLNNLFLSLKKSGINNITGNIYLDSHNSVGSRDSGPGWMWDELNICYAAPINNIMINHNCVNYTLLSNGQLKPKTNADSNIIINSQINFTNTNCSLDLNTIGPNHYTLSGCLNKNSKPLDLSIALTDPADYAKNLITQILKNNQIIFTGQILEKTTPTQSTIIITHFSKPLTELINNMLKDSDNQIAGELLKTIGARYYQAPADWKKSVEALENILSKNTDINLNHAAIVDGSGISRYNLITPDQLSALLNYVFHNKTIAKSYIESLPIAGKDGTLKDRMKNYTGKIYGKTGSMTGVECLAGYIQTKNHGVLSYVIMLNNFSMPQKDAESFIDNMLEQLAES